MRVKHDVVRGYQQNTTYYTLKEKTEVRDGNVKSADHTLLFCMARLHYHSKDQYILLLLFCTGLFWPQTVDLDSKRSTLNAENDFGFVFQVLFRGKTEISDTTIIDWHGKM